MQLLIKTSFFLFLLWPQADLIEKVYYRGNDLGVLADFHSYGGEDSCFVQARPLFSGEGLPLYESFERELTELSGFEFRIIYWTQDFNYNYDGYYIVITEEEKFLFEISKYKPLQTIYY